MLKLFTEETKFGRFLLKLTDHILLYFLWLIFSLPIITIGASTCGYYFAYNKSILDNDSDVWSAFWKAFKTNFKQATILWGVQAIIWIILAYNCQVAYFMKDEVINVTIMWIIIGVSVAIFAWTLYWLPYIALFEDSIKKVVKNCSVLLLLNLRQTVLVLAMIALIAVLFWYFLPLGLFSLTALYLALSCRVICKVLKKYMTAKYIAGGYTKDIEEETPIEE